MVRDIVTDDNKDLSPEEFESLVQIVGNFWTDIENEADRISPADKETVISYFNGMFSSLSGAFIDKYHMDTFHAHSHAGDEILSTALNLIYEKGLIRDFIVRFEAIPCVTEYTGNTSPKRST